MAAHEEKGERVVVIRRLPAVGKIEDGGRPLPPSPRALAPPFVYQSPRGDRHHPGTRVVRHAFLRPLDSRGEEGLLRCVLARVELSVPPHKHGEDLRRQLAQQILDSPLQPGVRTQAVRP